jgi:hypothetical protein
MGKQAFNQTKKILGLKAHAPENKCDEDCRCEKLRA